MGTPNVVINNVPIDINEIDNDIPLRLYRLESMKYKERENWIDKNVLKQEADKTGLTVSELLKEKVDDKVSISDKDISSYYEVNKKWMSGATLLQATNHINSQLIKKQKQDLYEEYLAKLYRKYKVEINLPKPIPIKVYENPVLSFSKGRKDAPVTIIVFSDYECNACGYFHNILKNIVNKNKKTLRIVFRHDAPPANKYSNKAAISAVCAGIQNKFWEYTDELFTYQQMLDDDNLLSYAERIKLDIPLFKGCIQSEYANKIVQTDMNEVDRLGINRTPAIFINGHFTDGVPSEEEVQKMIDEALEK